MRQRLEANCTTVDAALQRVRAAASTGALLSRWSAARSLPVLCSCGLEGMTVDISGGLYNMTECCNAHDICYDTCNSGMTLALGCCAAGRWGHVQR
jgi:hypothetical protein